MFRILLILITIFSIILLAKKDRVFLAYVVSEPGITISNATTTIETPISTVSVTPKPTKKVEKIQPDIDIVTENNEERDKINKENARQSQVKLVTNEFAYWNPYRMGISISDIWKMTSGSLFAVGNKYWTGKVDDETPDSSSTTGTNSAIFRLVTKDNSFKNFALSFNLEIVNMVSTAKTPPVDWDGVHVFLRYQDQYNLYYASVYRRDGLIVIKKKCKGGDSNGGEYYTISDVIKKENLKQINVTVKDLYDGKVQIQILDGQTVLLTGIDSGIGCPVISSSGSVGIRGDNTEFYFSDFSVTKY